jgi:hypothetical protein
VSFAAITLCAASQRVFIVVNVYFSMAQSGNFWIQPRTLTPYFCKIHFNIILPSTRMSLKWPLFSGFRIKFYIYGEPMHRQNYITNVDAKET